MAILSLTRNSLHKAEMECNGKFLHTIGRIQNIYPMIRIEIFYATCSIATQDVADTILMMAQISSDLHVVIIKFKTKQPELYIMPSRCRSCYNSQQKTVSFRFYPHYNWRCCLLESTYSIRYRIWLHWWINLMHVQRFK